ncbi:unnamed protein product [Arabidopsis arenosa]|uniref:Uncharacterized protein n=1 Tax=Arabidopsis arenosa TaxID=38785 RepID=A0A8S1ZYH2_ARAAE|nr:unnamed protein product [Arabidopsis arenosa]
MRRENDVGEDNGSILEETESVIIVFGEGNNVVNISPENCGISVLTETAVPPVKNQEFCVLKIEAAMEI